MVDGFPAMPEDGGAWLVGPVVDDVIVTRTSRPRPTDSSFAVRPGVGLTYAIRLRVAVIGFGGYLANRPGIVYRDGSGAEWRDRWRADAIVVSIGAAYSLF